MTEISRDARLDCVTHACRYVPSAALMLNINGARFSKQEKPKRVVQKHARFYAVCVCVCSCENGKLMVLNVQQAMRNELDSLSCIRIFL